MSLSISIRSRYIHTPLGPYRMYDGDEVERTDAVFYRRFTTWARPADAVDYVSKAGDTLIALATRFYGDHRLWWVLADHNPSVTYPLLDLTASTILVVPPLSAVGLSPMAP